MCFICNTHFFLFSRTCPPAAEAFYQTGVIEQQHIRNALEFSFLFMHTHTHKHTSASTHTRIQSFVCLPDFYVWQQSKVSMELGWPQTSVVFISSHFCISLSLPVNEWTINMQLVDTHPVKSEDLMGFLSFNGVLLLPEQREALLMLINGSDSSRLLEVCSVAQVIQRRSASPPPPHSLSLPLTEMKLDDTWLFPSTAQTWSQQVGVDISHNQIQKFTWWRWSCGATMSSCCPDDLLPHHRQEPMSSIFLFILEYCITQLW